MLVTVIPRLRLLPSLPLDFLRRCRLVSPDGWVAALPPGGLALFIVRGQARVLPDAWKAESRGCVCSFLPFIHTFHRTALTGDGAQNSACPPVPSRRVVSHNWCTHNFSITEEKGLHRSATSFSKFQQAQNNYWQLPLSQHLLLPSWKIIVLSDKWSSF